MRKDKSKPEAIDPPPRLDPPFPFRIVSFPHGYFGEVPAIDTDNKSK